ncbi:LysR substrate-binding domain-containing protein [Neisseria sp. oral taxon 014]|uniref:LysR substrate-binding domain-containing protein n=1 Tax=Neisseria sp. oral taxon 014 TaxID=641148 RepID=UPI0025D5A57F|nr:LysR substrate-binding domain-containing protein [Neisseria sp. oral taxon 014]
MHDIRQPSDLLNLLPLIHDDTLPSCTSTSAAVLQAAMDGGGIALVRSLLVSADLKAGRLVRLLPDISIPSPLAYYLVVPRRKLQFASGVCV